MGVWTLLVLWPDFKNVLLLSVGFLLLLFVFCPQRAALFSSWFQQFSDFGSGASQELASNPSLSVVGVKVAGTLGSPLQPPTITIELQR